MEILDTAKKETICIGGGTDVSGEALHIALTVTGNYISQAGVVMMSAVQYNPALKFVFHLLVNDLPAEEKVKLTEFVELTKATVYVHIMNDEPFKKNFHLHRFLPAFFYRLFIPDLLKEYTDRILYLDADMMVRGDLRPLQELDFQGNIAAVVEDRSSEGCRAQIDVERYFNAGMMFINVKKWAEENILDEILEMSHMLMKNLNKKGRIVIWHNAEYNDQTLANKVLDKRIIWLPKKYNYVYKLNRPALLHKQDYNEDYRNQVILHFASDVKPWHSWVQDWEAVKAYQDVRRQSPWKDLPLAQPVSRKNYHRAAREYRTIGAWGKAFCCYLEYYKREIAHKN